MNYPSEKYDWKKIYKNNITISLNVFYTKKEKIYPAYFSKYNSNCEKQIILLIIPDGEGWHYFAVNELSTLIKGIKSKQHGDFYYLNCFHSFAIENKCEFHKKVCENKDIFNLVMPFQFQLKNKLQELIKREKKIQKSYPTDYNLSIAQDLWQAHY